MGSKEGLQPVSKTIITAVWGWSIRRIGDPNPENVPILEDLYNLLEAEDEKKVRCIFTAVKIHMTGFLNVFNH